MRNYLGLSLVVLLVLIAVRCGADSADVTVPDSVSFLVTDVNGFTNSTPLEDEISFSGASLTPGNSIRFSIKADAANFTRPAEAGAFIPCDKIAFVTTGAVHGTGYAGILSFASWVPVFQATTGATWGSTNIGWTMNTVGEEVRAGDHVLSATWKIEAL